MNKRLRKKKRVGEFNELGFELLGDLRPGISGEVVDAFLDRLIVVVEARSSRGRRAARRSGLSALRAVLTPPSS